MATRLKIKLSTRKYRDDPWEHFTQLSKVGAVIPVKIPFMGKTWAATTYESVSSVFKDTQSFVRNPKNAGRNNIIPMQWILPRSFFHVIHNMLGADGQQHRRLRGVVDQAFARRNIDGMGQQLERLANEQADHLEKIASRSGGEVDLLEHFARPFPLTVICELLGLPAEDRPKFVKWFAPFSTVNSVFGIYKIGSGIRSVIKYFREQFEEVRKNPRPGLLSELVQIEHEGEQLSEDELLSMAFLLLVAGHETTVHLISNTILTLLQNPDVKDVLNNEWGMSDRVIDEVLRYASPIQIGKPRYVAADKEFFGQILKQGEMITPFIACSNYDSVRFEHPDVFDIDRDRNYHMTFGSGPHVCLGMKLTKAETYFGIRTLFERWPKMTALFDLARPDWSKRVGMRGMNSFRVKLG